jgi:plasmid stabilization system protein ParE
MPALVFHPLVEADLREASLWYEEQQSGLGARFEAEAYRHLRRLPAGALLYTLRFANIRRMNLKRFPYGVFYFLERDEVVVLGVLHAARDTREELERRRAAFE